MKMRRNIWNVDRKMPITNFRLRTDYQLFYKSVFVSIANKCMSAFPFTEQKEKADAKC